jgi:AmmeMemoRadiSam system protein A
MLCLSEADRCACLRLARHAVAEAACHGRLPQEIPCEGAFAVHQAVFVTLHVHNRLRGCIGVIEGEEPLGESIVRCAASAALQDPRFAPLRPEELPNLQIEISLLSPPAPIRPEEIEVGRHGLLIARGLQRGLLLPQVATEHHLAAEQFLSEACHKARLPREAWREAETQIMGFTCEVFSEEKNPALP